MNDQRALGSLAMCRRAGKLKIGFDASCAAVFKGAVLLVMSSDISEGTRKRVLRANDDLCEIAELPFTQNQIESVVGRKFAVAAVCDENFARLLKRNLPESKEADI